MAFRAVPGIVDTLKGRELSCFQGWIHDRDPLFPACIVVQFAACVAGRRGRHWPGSNRRVGPCSEYRGSDTALWRWRRSGHRRDQSAWAVHAPTTYVGSAVLQVERIGLAPARAGIALDGRSTVAHDVALFADPVLLEALTATAICRCGGGTAPAAAVAEVWARARDALGVASYVERARHIEVLGHQYTSEVDAGGAPLRGGPVQREFVTSGTPFVAPSNVILESSGFAIRDGTGYTFFAPTSTTLLSDVIVARTYAPADITLLHSSTATLVL